VGLGGLASMGFSSRTLWRRSWGRSTLLSPADRYVARCTLGDSLPMRTVVAFGLGLVFWPGALAAESTLGLDGLAIADAANRDQRGVLRAAEKVVTVGVGDVPRDAYLAALPSARRSAP